MTPRCSSCARSAAITLPHGPIRTRSTGPCTTSREPPGRCSSLSTCPTGSPRRRPRPHEAAASVLVALSDEVPAPSWGVYPPSTAVFHDTQLRDLPIAGPKVAVVGAGAAGTMAAIFAAAGGAETLLLERTRDGGRKILISGGGRCNILPAQPDERRFVTDSSLNTLAKDPALLAAAGADRLLRDRAGVDAGGGDGDGQTVPGIESRPRCS